MVLHKGDGGLQRLHCLFLVFHHDFLILLLYSNIFAYYGIRTEPECEAYNKTDTDLSNDLVFAFQSLLITLEDFDIVIHESEET